METNGKKEGAHLRKALSTAYHKKEEAEVSEGWQSELMHQIRKSGFLCGRPVFIEFFQRFVWRLAPVACALLFLFGLAVSQLHLFSDEILVVMFTEDPAEYVLTAFISE